MALAAIVFLLVSIAAAGLVAIPHLVTVGGLIQPDRGVIKVPMTTIGYIESILIGAGDELLPGDPIARLIASRDVPRDDVWSPQTAEEIQLRINTLARDLKTLDQTTASEHRRLVHRISLLRAELARARDEANALNDRLLLRQQDQKRIQDLQKQGFLSKGQLERAEDELLAAKASLAASERIQASIEREIAASNFEIEAVTSKTEFQKSNTEREMSQLRQQRQELDFQSNPTVSSPAHARVLVVHALPGQAMQAGAQIATLIPIDATMIAELCAGPREIPYLKIDQRVRLRYDFFPAEVYGAHFGRVTQIDHAGILAPGSTKPCYRVKVLPENQFVKGSSGMLPLVVGGAVQADIRIGERTAFQLILRRLIETQARTQ
jgi:membrane fusion protein